MFEFHKKYLEKWDRVNMASTHNAICMLIVLGDNLDRLDKKGAIETIRICYALIGKPQANI